MKIKLPKVRDYDPETYDDLDEEDEYKQNKLSKLNRKAEGFVSGGNKSRSKRNKKETFRVVEEEKE